MESLTLEQAYYIGELIAAIVVVISLIYVGRQVRQNTQAAQINAAQSFVEAYNTFTSDLTSSNEMADIWIRGSKDMQNLTNPERIRFSALTGQFFRLYQSAHIQWQNGAVDDESWSGMAVCMADTMQETGLQQMWSIRKRWYGDSFQEWVKAITNSVQGETAMPFIQESS